jgi:hypothetical protein
MRYLIYIFFIFLMFDIATAFDIDSPTYTIDNYHLGSTGSTGESSTFSMRSTTTFQQGGNQEASSTSYDLNIGHFSINDTFIPIKNEGVWQISSATGMTYRSGDIMKSIIQLRNQSNIYLNDKYCDVLYRYPNNTIWINWTEMPGIPESTGVYYYNTTTLPIEGIYAVEYRCKEVATDEIKAYAIENIYVSPWANQINNIDTIVTNINNTVNTINLNYINLNQTVTEIYNFLFGVNVSNPHPPDVEIISLVGGEHYKFTPSYLLEVNLNSTSSGNLNYTRIRVIDPDSILIFDYENSTLNSSSIYLAEAFNGYELGYGNYTLIVESTDDVGNYGAEINSFEILNRGPSNPSILTPNTDDTFTDILPITWLNSLDADHDARTVYFEYSSGAAWNSLFNQQVSNNFINHTCSLNSTIQNMTGEFTLLADFDIDTLEFILNASDDYYLYLNNSNDTYISEKAVCQANESCKFVFDDSVFNNTIYSWVVRFADSGILANGYHCNKSEDLMVLGGLQANIVMQATPSASLYNFDISTFTTSDQYLLRMRSYDGLLYSNWTNTSTEFTIVQTSTTSFGGTPSSGNLGEGILNETDDFMFCNLETGECFTRDDIEMTPQTSEQTIFSLVGAGDFSGGLKVLTASVSKTVTKVGNFGEGFGIPAFLFLFLILCLLILLGYYFFGGKKEDEPDQC